MSQKQWSQETVPVASAGNQIDVVCDRFEDVWKAGRQPRIEDYLAGWDEPELSKLLSELLSLELEYRSRTGQAPTQEELERRFADHRQVVADVFERRTAEQTVAGSGSDDTLVIPSNLEGLRFTRAAGSASFMLPRTAN